MARMKIKNMTAMTWAMVGVMLLAALTFGIVGTYLVQTTGKNRRALQRVCDTALVIRHLDEFFLGLTKPQKDETKEEKRIREAFIALITSDLKVLSKTDRTCDTIR